MKEEENVSHDRKWKSKSDRKKKIKNRPHDKTLFYVSTEKGVAQPALRTFRALSKKEKSKKNACQRDT